MIAHIDKNEYYLRAEDVSAMIRHFSIQIQQRLQQIDKNKNYFSCLTNTNSEQSGFQIQMLQRYHTYCTSNTHQIKLLHRLCQRVLQIYQYFKQGCSDPATFFGMQERIQNKLKQIMHAQVNQSVSNQKCKTEKYLPKSNSLNSQSEKQCLISINTKCTNIGQGVLTYKNTSSAGSVDVGSLFKFIFSTLKRGYLMKLKVERKQKNMETTNENRISIQGTGTILRCFSEKGKQNMNRSTIKKQVFDSHSKQVSSIASSKPNTSNLGKRAHLKKNNFLDYSITPFNNEKLVFSQQVRSRQIEKSLSSFNQIMELDKYFILRTVKDQQLCFRDCLRRNQCIDKQRKKYAQNYEGITFQTKIIKPNRQIRQIKSQSCKNQYMGFGSKQGNDDKQSNLDMFLEQQDQIIQQNSSKILKTEPSNIKSGKTRSKNNSRVYKKNRQVIDISTGFTDGNVLTQSSNRANRSSINRNKTNNSDHSKKDQTHKSMLASRLFQLSTQNQENFMPLFQKEKNSAQNIVIAQTVKKRHVMSNLHPLNRFRVYRQNRINNNGFSTKNHEKFKLNQISKTHDRKTRIVF